MSADPLRVACIGMGWWSDVLADAIQRSGKLEIRGCYTRSEEKRNNFAAKYRCWPAESYEALLADAEIEAIINTTPNDVHLATTCAAAAAGKHVFLDKPIANSIADGRAITEACRKAGVVLALGYQRRRESHFRYLRQQIDAGRRRDPDDVALSQFRRLEQPHVGGQAHAAERAEVGLRGRQLGVQPAQRRQPVQRRHPGGDDRVVAPASRVPDGVPHAEPLGPRGHHLADRDDPVHRGVEREGGKVAGRRVGGEAQSQRRVDRGPGVADQHLAGAGLVDLDLDHPEILEPHLAARVRIELDLPAATRFGHLAPLLQTKLSSCYWPGPRPGSAKAAEWG